MRIGTKKSAGNGIKPVLRLEALALPIAVRTSNAETHAVYINDITICKGSIIPHISEDVHIYTS